MRASFVAALGVVALLAVCLSPVSVTATTGELGFQYAPVITDVNNEVCDQVVIGLALQEPSSSGYCARNGTYTVYVYDAQDGQTVTIIERVTFDSNGNGQAVVTATQIMESSTGSVAIASGKATLSVSVAANDPTTGAMSSSSAAAVVVLNTCVSTVVGDPQFVGLRGQNYQVHGVSGEIYNIVSDAELQYNSRFVFLDHGECPVVNGKKQKNCWSHPGSYLGELGLKTASGDRVQLITGPAQQGFESVLVNDKEVSAGSTVLLADGMGSVSRNSSHVASVAIGNWAFVFENSDLFVNQQVRVRDARQLRSHGLLGQTWRQNTYPNAIKYIQGDVDDYVIRGKDLFGDNFVYNAFN